MALSALEGWRFELLEQVKYTKLKHSKFQYEN